MNCNITITFKTKTLGGSRNLKTLQYLNINKTLLATEYYLNRTLNIYPKQCLYTLVCYFSHH